MKKQVDISYIIGMLLLNKKEITESDIEAASRRLIMLNPDYEIIGNKKDSIAYWSDFFEVKEDDKIIRKTNNLDLMRMLFSDVLEYETYKDIDKIVRKI